jgi:uncharacterized protein YozE (UPF0346 family)
MHIYDDPAYAMAGEQFELIADYLEIEPNMRQRLFHPSGQWR